METMKPSQLVKRGFWTGIGFLIPLIGAYIGGTYLIYSMPFLWNTSSIEEVQTYLDESDKTDHIKIVSFRESMNADQLLILGVIENTGDAPVGSIRLEAELLDDRQQMVYECSEYISKKLKSHEKENFQVRCGCGSQVTPPYDTLSLRVVDASIY
ncbi:MAG: FxLYD domain-containing protein [Candidatus Thiodiazotropha sp.]